MWVTHTPVQGNTCLFSIQYKIHSPGHQAAIDIKNNIPVREFFRNSVEKLHHFFFSNVTHHSLGDREHRAVPGYLVEPVRVGDGRANQLVTLAVRVYLPAYLDYVGHIYVIPADSG